MVSASLPTSRVVDATFFNFLLLTMAAPLAQVTLNLPPGLVAGVQPPAQPENPPTAADVTAAVKLMANVSHELRLNTDIPADVVEAVTFYGADIIASKQLSLIAPAPAPAAAAPPAAPAAPLAGAAIVLNAIAALDRRLDRRLNDIQRQIAINGNMGKGTGHQIPYEEVLFLDGSRPSVAVPAQPGQPVCHALPALSNVDIIRNLSALRAGRYLTGHGVDLVPGGAPARRTRVAQCIGCIIDI